MLRLITVLLNLFFIFNLKASEDFYFPRDQGKSHINHIQIAEDFRKSWFLNENRYCPQKIKNTIERIINEKWITSSDLKETILLESVELDIEKIKKARKKLLEKLKTQQILFFLFTITI